MTSSTKTAGVNSSEFVQILIEKNCPQFLRGSCLELASLLEGLYQAEALPRRLDSFVALTHWLRAEDRRAAIQNSNSEITGGPFPPEWQRLALLIVLLERIPELRRSFNLTLSSIIAETRGVSLFAELGIPEEHRLMAEVSSRLLKRVLPTPRDDQDLSKLVLRLFPAEQEIHRFVQMPPELFERMVQVITPGALPEEWRPLVREILDAFALLGARIQSIGLSPKLRARGQSVAVRESPYFRLTRVGDQLLQSLEETAEKAKEWEEQWHAVVAQCREEADEIERHLEETGVDLAVVFGLNVIHTSLSRMELIVETLIKPPGAERIAAIKGLLDSVVVGRQAHRSLVHLAHDNLQLLARKIVERAGKTGEHYIARNRAEYWQMWLAAAGGGLLTVGTAAIKMEVTHLGLAAFPEGFLAGLNYAVSFVLLQILGLVLATKQPSMTAAKLASIVRDNRGDSRIEEIVAYFARIFRSQLAAALGNVIVVSLGAVVFDQLWRLGTGKPYLSEELAIYALVSLSPVSTGTVIYAALTGVILWLASLLGGWIENWYVYNRLPEGLKELPIGKRVGENRLQMWVDGLSRNVSGWGVSISLGFMLGMTPELGRILGIPLDVRHVTLNTGIMSLGAAALGRDWLRQGWFLFACAGIAVTFVLNLTVSFLLALRLALQAFDVPRGEQRQLLKALVRSFFQKPRRFLFPPRE
jgi:site-specific recombinase